MIFHFGKLYFLISAVAAARRGRHRMFGVRVDMSVEIDIGTPPLMRNVRIDTVASHLLVMDVACNDPNRLVECPKYCEDGIIGSIFCSPLCGYFSPAETLSRCGTDYLYDPKNSSTFRPLSTEVEWTFRDLRPLTGRLAKEAFSVGTERVMKTKGPDYRKQRVFETTGFEFIRGFRFDFSRLFGQTGLFGLSPRGGRSLIPQLKLLRVLDRAIVTIQMINYPIMMSFFSQPILDYQMIAGALDKYQCRNWRLFPAFSDNDWDFKISEINFLGNKFSGKIIDITVPKDVVEELADAGLVSVSTDGTLRLQNSVRITELEFRVGQQTVRITPFWLRRGKDGLKMRIGEETRYTDDARWSFGHFFLGTMCYGYDYDRRSVLWGDRRNIKINDDYNYT